MVEIHQKLRRGTSSAEHTRHHEHHIYEASTETFKVGGSFRIAPDGGGAIEEPGVHGDAGAVVGQRRLVVLVDKMMVEKVEVLGGKFLSVELLDAVGQQATVEADKTCLRQFPYEGGTILVFHIGVGIVFAARCGIGGSTVVH